jgi:multidrug resistance efflux pump
VALARCEIRSPFDGTVGAIQVRAGELVVPNQPLVTLGDLATLRVETTDLGEFDVARVTVGQEATITFDALPNQTFTGRLTRIDPMADPGSGGVNYTAVVELDEIPDQVRWGMTAFVDIEVAE